ncbi:MAG: hypothetical protein IPQ07_42570 [Myxococcales bacterium]|nr:hypothetical protein [Myxococcales bacterium]
MAADGVFADLRRLADWFSTSPQRGSLHIERTVQRLGITAVPLLGRELRSPDRRRREAARAALAALADDLVTRGRVITELRAVTTDPAIHDDEVKVSALGLLAELGEKAAAVFSDPREIQRRSAIALASQLATDADVASAADLMVATLGDDDIAQMLDVMSEAEPVAAQRLGAELAVRMDVASDARERFAAVIAQRIVPTVRPATERRRAARPTHVAVLIDASARLVVVASKKIAGERRWRRWAVLIGPSGRIDDCLHEDDATDASDAAPLIANLVADGYRVASTELDHARTVVTTAARLTARPLDRATGLTSAYYLGRDLLDLGDAHVGERTKPAPALIARAIEQTAESLVNGDHAKAQAMLELCDPANPDVAAATATLCLAARPPRTADAIAALERALAVEPEWPLHHWNLAAALHAQGDSSGCFHALRRFIATSSTPTGLYADPDQPARVGSAHRMMADLERAARLTGTSLRRRRRKPAAR